MERLARPLLFFLSVLEMDDEKFMRMALQEARKAYEENEIPIGAVIVADNRVIAKGHNMTECLKDVTAHAEMIAITAAEQKYGGKYLDGCTLYVTLEPCLMCAGAIGWSQIKRLVYGAKDIKRGYSLYLNSRSNPFHPRTIVEGGLLENECSEILKEFFKSKR